MQLVFESLEHFDLSPRSYYANINMFMSRVSNVLSSGTSSEIFPKIPDDQYPSHMLLPSLEFLLGVGR
jgi:hypothetical protein